MDPAEVVIGEIESERRSKILPFLAEGNSQTGITSHGGANIQVLAFYV
jgi:hypothetical protein